MPDTNVYMENLFKNVSSFDRHNLVKRLLYRMGCLEEGAWSPPFFTDYATVSRISLKKSVKFANEPKTFSVPTLSLISNKLDLVS